jgi:hypothetical protein
MDLSELKVLARDLLGEKGEYWPDAQMDRLANMANRIVYRAVANADPSYFLDQETITYTGEAESVDLKAASFLNIQKDPYRVVDVAVLSGTAAAVTSTNQPVSLEYLDPTEINTYHTSIHDPYHHRWDTRWTLVRDGDLMLTPIPATDTTIVVRFIQQPLTLTHDNDIVLNPDTSDAHPITSQHAAGYYDLVTSLFCKILSTKERRQALELSELMLFVSNEVKQVELSRTNSQKIIYESPY